MRLFIAADVDRATRDAAAALRARLARERPTVERALRWVETGNMHLTLRFLGEREDLSALQQALAPPWAQPRFSLGWMTPSWLPPHGRPRVFYVAVGEGAHELATLAADIARRLEALGIEPEDRPFTAHLTLARTRDGAEPGVLRLLRALVPVEPFAPGLRVPVSAVTLYRSELSSRGPSYSVQYRSELS